MPKKILTKTVKKLGLMTPILKIGAYVPFLKCDENFWKFSKIFLKIWGLRPSFRNMPKKYWKKFSKICGLCPSFETNFKKLGVYAQISKMPKKFEKFSKHFKNLGLTPQS